MKGIVMIIDPTLHFMNGLSDAEKIDKQQYIFDAAGFIPGWILNDLDHDDLNMKDMLETYYSWGMFPMEGGVVNEDGTYDYPGDPKLFPLISIARGEETLYQYRYGIVSIVQKDGTAFVTRMD